MIAKHDHEPSADTDLPAQMLGDELSIFRGTFYGTLGVLVMTAVGFITNVWLARGLGADGYGIWSLGLLTVTLVSLVANLGMERGVSRLVGLYRGRKKPYLVGRTIWGGLVIACLTGLVATVALLASAGWLERFFRQPLLSSVVRSAAAIALLETVLVVPVAAFRGYEDVRMAALVHRYIRAFLWLACVALLSILAVLTPWRVGLAYSSVSALVLAIGLAFFARHKASQSLFEQVDKDLNPRASMIGPLIAFSSPLLMSQILDFTNTRVGTFVVGYFLPAAQAGSYYAASRVASLSVFVLPPIAQIVIPVVARSYAQGRLEQVNSLYRRTAKWSFLATVPIVLVALVFRNFVMGLFGSTFLGNSATLALLLLASIIHAIVGPGGAVLTALGDTGFVALYNSLGMVTNMGVALYLTPRWGAEGAAVGLLASVLVVNIAPLMRLQSVYRIGLLTADYSIYILVTLISGLLIGLIVDQLISNALVAVPIFVLVLVSMQWLLVRRIRILDQRDIALANLAIHKVRSAISR